MKLLYHKGDVLNFGDDLNEELWPTIAPEFSQPSSGEHGFLGIGTIIGKPLERVKHLHVFGSGAGYDAIRFYADNVSVWCVRGPLTAQLLGINRSAALTDGAVLCPLVYPKGEATGRTVLIPHWQTIHGNEKAWLKACQLAEVDLVNPMAPPSDVIRQISGAKRVLTESLHGAILADTYSVPWTAWTCTGNISAFKWMDWTASVGVPFELNVLAPPTLKIHKKLGRPSAQPGESMHYTEEEVMDAIGVEPEPMAATLLSKLKNKTKTLVKNSLFDSPITNALLKSSPQDTARGIEALVEQNGLLSAETRRQELQTEMLNRLQACLSIATGNPNLVIDGAGEDTKEIAPFAVNAS